MVFLGNILSAIRGLLAKSSAPPPASAPVEAPALRASPGLARREAIRVPLARPKHAVHNPLGCEQTQLPARQSPAIETIPRDHRPGLRLAAAIDVETTGTALSDEAIELAIVLFAFDSETHEMAGVIDSYCGRREPGVAINPFAQRVHGISIEELRGCSIDRHRVAQIAADAEFFIAHNASFDRRFVADIVAGTSDRVWVCSMSRIDWTACRSRKLKDIRHAHGITECGAHTALGDVRSLLSVLAMRNALGQTYLGELVTNCGLHTIACRPLVTAERKPRKNRRAIDPRLLPQKIDYRF